MGLNKKKNTIDKSVQIRILKAMNKLNFFGPFKHFNMIILLKGLKQPNIITPQLVYKYLSTEFDTKYYESKEVENIQKSCSYFDSIFDE
ncbi:hypothetical protein EHP00_196 [Ecytonucleospora hepatopenaei]|uniref:Uncharacterized protein n=1 Tax=Ecytonucleospora hepatopenaei TaxID=646526 RepID=A0A1W0E6G5_9MICR|nr:hypothetical protein EHP00_196 [Ecytonucleospora hepatopenaei]